MQFLSTPFAVFSVHFKYLELDLKYNK